VEGNASVTTTSLAGVPIICIKGTKKILLGQEHQAILKNSRGGEKVLPRREQEKGENDESRASIPHLSWCSNIVAFS